MQNNSCVLLARGIGVAFAQQSLLESSLFVRAGPQARQVCRFPAHVAFGCLEPRCLGRRHVLFRCQGLSTTRNGGKAAGARDCFVKNTNKPHTFSRDCILQTNMMPAAQRKKSRHPAVWGVAQEKVESPLRNHEKGKTPRCESCFSLHVRMICCVSIFSFACVGCRLLRHSVSSFNLAFTNTSYTTQKSHTRGRSAQ